MARIYQTPTKEQLLSNANDEFKETLNKMIAIQDIIINDPPNDKIFKDNSTNYLIRYSNIIYQIENDNARYNDEYIAKVINNLYDDIFKNRRY